MYQEYLKFAKDIALYAGKVTNLYGENERYDTVIKGAIITNGISHNQILDKVKKHLM